MGRLIEEGVPALLAFAAVLLVAWWVFVRVSGWFSAHRARDISHRPWVVVTSEPQAGAQGAETVVFLARQGCEAALERHYRREDSSVLVGSVPLTGHDYFAAVADLQARAGDQASDMNVVAMV